MLVNLRHPYRVTCGTPSPTLLVVAGVQSHRVTIIKELKMLRRKKTKTAKIRSFIAANPNASARYIADQLNVTIQSVYNVKYKLRAAENKPKVVTLVGVSDKSIMEQLNPDIPVYKDSVTNVTSTRLKELLSKRLMQGTHRPEHPVLDKDLDNPIPAKKSAEIKNKLIMEYFPPSDPVNNPDHYTDGGIETIDYIEAKGLGYHLGNAVKYISRAGKKGTNQGLEDLKKAQWYLARAIEKNEYASPSR
jgi:hypothetical protein